MEERTKNIWVKQIYKDWLQISHLTLYFFNLTYMRPNVTIRGNVGYHCSICVGGNFARK
jgi:hypothetical protein